MQSKEDFVRMLWPSALEASKATGIDPRIIVAQAAQETGWGRSAPGNNFFGIKSHGKPGGQTFKTHEVINGQRVGMNDSFRRFDSPADSVAGYADFMTSNPRYRPMRQADGLDAQLQALGASGYATDPNYARSVGSIARTLPQPSTMTPEMMDFVRNNPQPGGYDPSIERQVAPQQPMQQPSMPSPNRANTEMAGGPPMREPAVMRADPRSAMSNPAAIAYNVQQTGNPSGSLDYGKPPMQGLFSFNKFPFTLGT